MQFSPEQCPLSVQTGWQAVLWRMRHGWERFVLSESYSMHISVDWAKNREQLVHSSEECSQSGSIGVAGGGAEEEDA